MDPNKIELPKIPKVNSNAKSVDNYKKKKLSTHNYTEEEIKQYNYNFIIELFLVTKGIPANENDASKWMNTLNQGASYEGIYRALVLGNAYYGLESMGNPLNDSTIEFTMSFLNKYVGSLIEKETLEKTNFYTLKRVTVEKALDVIDALLENENDLLKWYSVFSTELAETYPYAWNKEVRKITDAKRHMEWARSVTPAIIKAEVVIKIHKVFNYLNQS